MHLFGNDIFHHSFRKRLKQSLCTPIQIISTFGLLIQTYFQSTSRAYLNSRCSYLLVFCLSFHLISPSSPYSMWIFHFLASWTPFPATAQLLHFRLPWSSRGCRRLASPYTYNYFQHVRSTFGTKVPKGNFVTNYDSNSDVLNTIWINSKL